MFSAFLVLAGSTLAQASMPSENSRVACNSPGTSFVHTWLTTSGPPKVDSGVWFTATNVQGGNAVKLFTGTGNPDNPDIDVDDSAAENVVVVWAAEDSTNTYYIYGILNPANANSMPFRIGLMTGGTYMGGRLPRVSLKRTPLANGNLVMSVAWATGNAGVGLAAGMDVGGVQIQSFQLNPANPGNPVAVAMPSVSVPDIVDGDGVDYSFGDIDAGDTGNPVVTYGRTTGAHTGFFVKSYNLATSNYTTLSNSSLVFDETYVSGNNYYGRSTLNCRHNGTFTVAADSAGSIDNGAGITCVDFTAAGVAGTSDTIFTGRQQGVGGDGGEINDFGDIAIAGPRNGTSSLVVYRQSNRHSCGSQTPNANVYSVTYSGGAATTPQPYTTYTAGNFAYEVSVAVSDLTNGNSSSELSWTYITSAGYPPVVH